MVHVFICPLASFSPSSWLMYPWFHPSSSLLWFFSLNLSYPATGQSGTSLNPSTYSQAKNHKHNNFNVYNYGLQDLHRDLLLSWWIIHISLHKQIKYYHGKQELKKNGNHFRQNKKICSKSWEGGEIVSSNWKMDSEGGLVWDVEMRRKWMRWTGADRLYQICFLFQ